VAVLEFKAGARAAQGQSVPFKLCGESFRTAADPSMFPLLEMAALSAEQDAGGEGTIDTAVALYDFLRALVHPDDWDRFRRVCSRNRLDETLLMEIVQGLVPEVYGRPTTPPSDSAPSLSRNGRSSTGDSRPRASRPKT
jgi:hypothetical protein